MSPRILLFLSVSLLLLIGCGAGDEAAEQATTSAVPPNEDQITANNRGVALMGSFDYTAAHAVFLELVEAHPDWSPVVLNLAAATLNLQTEGSETEAIRLAESVPASDPEYVRAAYIVGLMRLYLGEVEVAKQHFQRVVELDPNDAYAQYHLAQCEAKSGNYEQAARLFAAAIELDGYLRSAYFGRFQALQRLRRMDEARPMLEAFQKLERNPRARLVEFKYTRMGPKADAQVVDAAASAPPRKPEGPLFAEARELTELPDGWSWTETPGALTAADWSGDGTLDLMLCDAVTRDGVRGNALLRGTPAGGFVFAADHPLTWPAARAVAWGDSDNDGGLEAFVLHEDAARLRRADDSGDWKDLTAESGIQVGAGARDAMWFDADHDGDLDLLVTRDEGPFQLWNNNLDGSFRLLGEEDGLTPTAWHAMAVDDIDNDRDVDLLGIGADGGRLYRNDRLWRYEASADDAPFAAVQHDDLVTADADADGLPELYSVQDGAVHVWTMDDGALTLQHVYSAAPAGPLHVVDLDGDGILELLGVQEGRPAVLPLDGQTTTTPVSELVVSAMTTLALDPAAGPSLLVWSEGRPRLLPPGTGRNRFIGLSFSGKEDTANSMRSNALGIGARFALRRGSHWTAFTSYRAGGGPGQSVQPILLGAGGDERIDFIAITWSDGVFQTELNLPAGELHAITETQRQLSSCPVLFAWNGERFEFISDVLGVGGMGFAVGPGEYATPRPWEFFQLPDAIAPVDGTLRLRITEPMEEAAYLDHMTVRAHDLPPGVRMVLDERMGVAAPLPTGEARYYREALPPKRAVNERGENVLDAVLKADRRAAPVGALDHRFIGLLAGEHLLELEFGTPIDPERGAPMLVIDGWVEYPYSQTSFAAWQAGRRYTPPSLEAFVNGAWSMIHREWGYPAGMPRRMSLPLDAVPAGTTRLRLRTNQEVYWDRVALAYAVPRPEDVGVVELSLKRAELAKVGFAKRTTGEQRLPHYDDAARTPLWDTRHQSGFYTALGDVAELLTHADDALVVMGPGEGVTMDFTAPTEPPPAGWTRRFVLDAKGWCKDMDLYTQHGETLAPIPARGSGDNPERARLHERCLTRYAGGH